MLVDFVEYWHYTPADKKSGSKATSERRLLAFVVAPDRPVEMVPLGAMQPINEAIETWRVTFGMSAEGAAAARLLRERLWAPMEEKLHGAKIVLISPDGALSRLPFGALPGKTPGTYLIEERSVRRGPRAAVDPATGARGRAKTVAEETAALGQRGLRRPPAKGRIGVQPVSKDSRAD